MNAPEHFLLPDIQSTADHRSLAISRVGVKSIVHPVKVRAGSADAQHTIATIDMYVGLPPEVKGTHMSRFLEILQAHRGAIDAQAMRGLMERLRSERPVS